MSKRVSRSAFSVYTIEIINIVDYRDYKHWERSDWGGEFKPGCSLIHDVPGKKVILNAFLCFLKCFSS